MKKNEILFSEIVPNAYCEEFVEKVIEISTNLDIHPDWLMLTMYIESARTFSASIQNGKSKATGLIQFMPSTAKQLGTSTDVLANMTEVEQLDWVYKYLSVYKNKMKSFEDVYLAVFFPLAIGKSDNFVLEAKGLPAEKVASWNPLYDLNKDGEIQKYEVRQKLLSFLPKGYISK